MIEQIALKRGHEIVLIVDENNRKDCSGDQLKKADVAIDFSIPGVAGEVPGIHSVIYKSSVDEIEIHHSAFSREGFAQGAVLAAEFLNGKKGIYSMEDLLKM